MVDGLTLHGSIQYYKENIFDYQHRCANHCAQVPSPTSHGVARGPYQNADATHCLAIYDCQSQSQRYSRRVLQHTHTHTHTIKRILDAFKVISIWWKTINVSNNISVAVVIDIKTIRTRHSQTTAKAHIAFAGEGASTYFGTSLTSVSRSVVVGKRRAAVNMYGGVTIQVYSTCEYEPHTVRVFNSAQLDRAQEQPQIVLHLVSRLRTHTVL